MIVNTPQKISLGFFALIFIFWSILFFLGIREGVYNYLYSFLFGFIPLVGGLIAIFSSKLWGGLSTAMGKAIFFIGFGVFLWGGGETIWSYYNFFLGVPAPYPSLADLLFAPSIFSYGLGAFYLSKVTGAKFGFKTGLAKVFVFLSLITVSALSYYVLIVVARGGVLITEGETVLKMILDIAYPVGDFLGLLIAIIISGLSFRYLGGKYTYDIISILSGIAVMFIADSVFSYTTTIGTYYNGNFGDLLLALGMFLLTFGILGFYKLKED